MVKLPMLSARCYLVVVLWHFWGDGHDLPGYTAPIILKNLGYSQIPIFMPHELHIRTFTHT